MECLLINPAAFTWGRITARLGQGMTSYGDSSQLLFSIAMEKLQL